MKPSPWRISYKETVETKLKKDHRSEARRIPIFKDRTDKHEFEKDTKNQKVRDKRRDLTEKLNQGNLGKKDSR